MPRYWRDPDSMTVHQYRGGPDKYEVAVIPVEKWLRLVELINEGRFAGSIYEIDTIIAEVDG